MCGVIQSLPFKENCMDFLALATVLLFFLASRALLALCQHLMGSK
jgi:hypothetical protein